MYTLSRKFGIPMWKLYDMNDFKVGQNLPAGTMVYVEYKSLHAAVNTQPILFATTDFYTISRLYGIGQFGRNEQIRRRKRQWKPVQIFM